MDLLDKAKQQEQMARKIAVEAVKTADIETEMPDEENGERYCLDCGHTISAKRLKARPQSVRCVPCKSAQEHKNQGYR